MRTIKTLIAAAALLFVGLAYAGQPIVYTINLPSVTPATNQIASIVNCTNFTITTPSGGIISNYFDTELLSQFNVWGTLTVVSNAAFGGGDVGTYTFNTLVSPDGTLWQAGQPFIVTIAAATTPTNILGVVSSNYSASLFRYWTITNCTTTVSNSTGTPNLKLFIRGL